MDSRTASARDYLKPGKTERAPDDWGSIAAWAWGMSRVEDYFETDPAIDAKRVAIHGVSRLGKTVMWAGRARSAVCAVIASCSGEGGAALSHRDYGETIAHLTAPTRYPYQFAANYANWGGFPDKAPMDANMLIALIAPRPLLLQTGNTDYWSDPKGEFLAEVAAGPVYKLLGKDPLDTDVWPAAKTPILHDLAYYMHDGGHGMVPTDWDIYVRVPEDAFASGAVTAIARSADRTPCAVRDRKCRGREEMRKVKRVGLLLAAALRLGAAGLARCAKRPAARRIAGARAGVSQSA